MSIQPPNPACGHGPAPSLSGRKAADTFDADDCTYGFGAIRKAEPLLEPAVATADSRAQGIGFRNDTDLRRWCVGEVAKSKASYNLAGEVRALYDFLTEAA